MSDQTLSQNVLGPPHAREKTREMPVGSELMIAFALGASGWYVIVRLIQWVAF